MLMPLFIYIYDFTWDKCLFGGISEYDLKNIDFKNHKKN